MPHWFAPYMNGGSSSHGSPGTHSSGVNVKEGGALAPEADRTFVARKVGDPGREGGADEVAEFTPEECR
jgi:hypothetical protein